MPNWYEQAEQLLGEVVACVPSYGGRSFVSLCPLELDCCCDVIAVTPGFPALRAVTSGAPPGSVVQNPVSCGSFRYVATFIVSIGQPNLLCENSPSDDAYKEEANDVFTSIADIHSCLVAGWRAGSCGSQKGLGDISVQCEGGCAVASFTVQIEVG